MGAEIQMTHVGGLEAACALAVTSGESLAGLIYRKSNQHEYDCLEMDAYARHLTLLGDHSEANNLTPTILTNAASKFL